MTVVIEMGYPGNGASSYSDNKYYAGKYPKARAADARLWHELTYYAEPWAGRPPLRSPVRLTFYWDDRLDLSNHSIMAKMIEDGLKGRLIRDDSRKHVVEIRHRWHDGGNIKIVIEEVENG